MGEHRDWNEPGCSVRDDGAIVYAWPPQGRFVELWARIDAALPDDEKDEALSLLELWQDDNSTLVAYEDENGEWVDVEPDWDEPQRWLHDA